MRWHCWDCVIDWGERAAGEKRKKIISGFFYRHVTLFLPIIKPGGNTIMAKAGMKRPDPKGQQSKESDQVLRIRSRLHTGDRVQPLKCSLSEPVFHNELFIFVNDWLKSDFLIHMQRIIIFLYRQGSSFISFVS